jgi:hypothetical protein
VTNTIPVYRRSDVPQNSAYWMPRGSFVRHLKTDDWMEWPAGIYARPDDPRTDEELRKWAEDTQLP